MESLLDKSDEQNNLPDISLNERKKLAEGYAVLLRRDGLPANEVQIRVKEMYSLSEEEARESWIRSQSNFEKEHKEVSRNTIRNAIIGVFSAIFVLSLYGIFFNQISHGLAVIIFALAALSLMGLGSFLIEYQTPSLSKFPLKFFTPKNEIAYLIPVFFLLVLINGGMYLFDNNVIETNDGYWTSGQIHAYGERDHTGGKSKQYFTVMKLEGDETEYRLFDSELDYAIRQPKYFNLRPGAEINIFIRTSGWNAEDSGVKEIVNLQQGKLEMTNLSRRKSLVIAENLKSFWMAILLFTSTLLISIAYGYYLSKRRGFSDEFFEYRPLNNGL